MSGAEVILDRALAAASPGKTGVERLREELRAKTAEVLHRMADRIYAVDLIEPDNSALGPKQGLDHLMRVCLREAGQDDGQDVGRVPLHVYSLQELKLAFGPEWRRLAPKAMKVVEIVLRQRLGPTDTYLRHADNAFVVHMGGDHGQQAPRRATRILMDLRRGLLGGASGQGKGFGVQLERSTLGDLLSKGISPEPAPVAETTLAVAVSPPKVELSPGEVAARLHKQLSFSFSPIWAPSEGRVVGYQTLARRHTDYGIYRGKWVLNGGYEDPFSLGVDLRMVDAAAQQAKRPDGEETPPRLILPVHNRSLLGRSRERVLRALETQSEGSARKMIVPEIVGILEAHPLTLLPETIAELKAIFGTVYVRLIPGAEASLLPHLGGVEGVGLDMNELARHGVAADRRRQALKDFGAALKDAKGLAAATRYVWDLHSAGEIKLAMGEGFTHVSGTAVGLEDAEARSPHPLSADRLGLGKGR